MMNLIELLQIDNFIPEMCTPFLPNNFLSNNQMKAIVQITDMAQFNDTKMQTTFWDQFYDNGLSNFLKALQSPNYIPNMLKIARPELPISDRIMAALYAFRVLATNEDPKHAIQHVGVIGPYAKIVQYAIDNDVVDEKYMWDPAIELVKFFLTDPSVRQVKVAMDAIAKSEWTKLVVKYIDNPEFRAFIITYPLPRS